MPIFSEPVRQTRLATLTRASKIGDAERVRGPHTCPGQAAYLCGLHGCNQAVLAPLQRLAGVNHAVDQADYLLPETHCDSRQAWPLLPQTLSMHCI
eukprot:scaffold27360_cov53-Prasinocladus_malaysianus.AAC.3